MKFSVMIDTHVDKIDVIELAEQLGYHRAFIPDSQLIWSDAYVALTVAALRTRRIHLSTGVTNSVTRVAPVTANAAASLNRLAPGRISIGIGTGHTALRMMGQSPASVPQLAEYIRVVRSLLSGAPVEYSFNGRTAEIEFQNLDRKYLNLEDPIPIFVAANGARALRLAAEAGDGWITAGGVKAEIIAANWNELESRARKVGRTLPSNYLSCAIVSACILQPGETLASDRVIDECGTMVTGGLHFAYEVWEQAGRDDSLIPSQFAPMWDEYVDRVAAFTSPAPARAREIHEGHATYFLPAERRFVTPDAIRATCLVGDEAEIIEQVGEFEKAGINELCIMPAADCQRNVFQTFAAQIMPHFG